jgi:hypothetical protein
MRKLILFDLDGTLTESRLPITQESAELFKLLLGNYYVGVVSGCSIDQMKHQLSGVLSSDKLNKLYLFPSTSTCLYSYKKEWVCIYKDVFNKEYSDTIKQTLLEVCKDVIIDKPYGEVIDDRGGQIAIALMGLNAPLELKTNFDADYKIRLPLKLILEEVLPECEITIGGTTTITVTKKGMDKTNCVPLIKEYIGIEKHDILFIGDTIFKNGNDYPMKQIGLDCINVSNPDDTNIIIRGLLWNTK